jgi:hypothetical protein
MLIVGDLDGDGTPDVATPSDTEGGVAVALGKAGGALGWANRYPAGASTYWVAAGDLDGDGRTDLATVLPHTGVGVLYAQASGGWALGETCPAGADPSGVAIGDVNGDGKDDLVVASYEDAQLVTLVAK